MLVAGWEAGRKEGFLGSDPWGSICGQDLKRVRARLGFVFHSAGNNRTWGLPVKESGPSSGSPFAGVELDPQSRVLAHNTLNRRMG